MLREKALGEGRRFLLFGLIGAAAFVVDAAVLAAELALGVPRVLARIVSLFVGMNFTFALNRAFTFAAFRGQSLGRQYVMYLAANSLGALVNYGVFLLLTAPGAWLEAMPIAGVAAGSIAGLGFNFTASRLTAFRR